MKNSHGGEIYNKNIKIDFSININPLGMPTTVKNSIIQNVDNFEIYPDTECLELRKKISLIEKVPFENIVCGNGADDLIFRIASALTPNKALILSPTFSEYEKSLMDCKIKRYTLKSKYNFKIQSDILDYISNIDIMYLCNPNNPTGVLLDSNLYSSIVDKCIKENVTLIVDECFLDFTMNGKSFKEYLSLDVNLIILKAFTKIYSMAGIRLGYALCSNTDLCEKIFNSGQSWSVSTVAQICGLSALDCTEYIEHTKKYIQTEREFLFSKLKKMNLKFYPTNANYILIQSNLDLYSLLLKEDILIRDCSNYIGLDSSYFRIAIKNHGDNITLVNILEKLLIGSDSFE